MQRKKKERNTRNRYLILKSKLSDEGNRIHKTEITKASKSYKRAILRAEREYKKQYIKKLREMKTKNPKQYWKILNAKNRKPKVNIPLEEMKNYFKSLYSTEDDLDDEPVLESPTVEQDEEM